MDRSAEITSNFILNDFDVYFQNTRATGGYISTEWALLGYTSPEKSMTRINEKYRKESKIPRVEVFTKTIRKGLTLTFELSNYNEDFIAMITQGTNTDLGASTGTRIAHGTEEAALEYRTLRFTTTREDGTTYAIEIPKAEIKVEGDTTFGGETEAVLPLMVTAVYNPSVSATGSLYAELFLASTLNATAIAPQGF